MKTSIILGTMSVLAAAALTKHRFVTAAGAVPASGAFCPGVANANYDAGEVNLVAMPNFHVAGLNMGPDGEGFT